MLRFKGLRFDEGNIPQSAHNTSVVIGNMDGVHRGHQYLLDEAKIHGKLGVLTFHPHPRRFFAPDSPPFMILSQEVKKRFLSDLGVEVMFDFPFDEKIASMTADDFINMLVHDLKIKHVTVGADFCFGKGRGGNVNDLKSCPNFTTSICDKVNYQGTHISSTRIRKGIEAGDIKNVTALLGRPWEIEGEVIKGDGDGKTLGFPTINLNLGCVITPKPGIYTVTVTIEQKNYKGVAYYGDKPTLGDDYQPRLEVFILNFNSDLYEKRARVIFHKFMREDKKFDSIDKLKAAIHQDCEMRQSENP